MNSFAASAKAQAVTNKTVGTNGAAAYKSTGKDNLDLFSRSGEIKYPNFLKDFIEAFKEDRDLALRNLLHTRDAREGKGVRNTFQQGLVWLGQVMPDIILQSNLLEKTVEVGYWKDLHVLVNDARVALPVKRKVVRLIAEALTAGDKLAAKWMTLKGPVARMVSAYMKLSSKQLRQLVVPLRADVTERKMCERTWHLIEYSHVPSRCMHLNRNAFRKHDETRFTNFCERAATGEVKVNASVLYPHEVANAYRLMTVVDTRRSMPNLQADPLAEGQWKNLPNLLGDNPKSVLPVIDLSGSMNTTTGNWSYAHIAVSLGAYISERIEGPFKNLVTTFASEPAFVDLSGCNTLLDRIVEIQKGRIGYSTNVNGTLKLILNHAIANNVSQEDMPDSLLFLTDCQSNAMGHGATIQDEVVRLYREAGYTPPKVIYWVLNAVAVGNTPVTFNTQGAAVVSSFSPSILKGVLSDIEQYTPYNVMLETLNSERYSLTYTQA